MAVGVTTTPAPPRKAPDRRDFKVLLEEEYEVAMANLPRAAWEPWSKIKTEKISALIRLATDQEQRPRTEPQFAALVPLDEAICSRWDEVEFYLQTLMKVSPGVQALRSNQLVAAFRGADEWKTNQAKGIAVEPAQGGEKRARRGVFSR